MIRRSVSMYPPLPSYSSYLRGLNSRYSCFPVLNSMCLMLPGLNSTHFMFPVFKKIEFKRENNACSSQYENRILKNGM